MNPVTVNDTGPRGSPDRIFYDGRFSTICDGPGLVGILK